MATVLNLYDRWLRRKADLTQRYFTEMLGDNFPAVFFRHV